MVLNHITKELSIIYGRVSLREDVSEFKCFYDGNFLVFLNFNHLFSEKRVYSSSKALNLTKLQQTLSYRIVRARLMTSKEVRKLFIKICFPISLF
jgi:hypothetical protein